MSSTATRIRRARLVDTIGVLAVVVGLVLGLVPGLSPAARADITAECQTHPNFTLDRVILEITGDAGTFTLDSDDDYLECFDDDSNQVGLQFVDDIDDSSPLDQFEGLRLFTQPGLDDAPLFHVSCSVTYTGTTLYLGERDLSDSEYTDQADYEFLIRQATLYSITGTDRDGNPRYKVSNDCVAPSAGASVTKVDDGGQPLGGAVFTLFEQGTDVVADTELPNPCTTDDDGTCDFGEVAPGDYTIAETTPPTGYDLPSTASQDFTLSAGEQETFTFSDPRLDYTIDVTPNGRNAVGNAHEFAVTLSQDDVLLGDATIALSWSGDGDGITEVVDRDGTTPHTDGVSATSCTTTASGTCTVTVDSDDAGGGTLTATYDTPYQHDNDSTAGPDLDDEVSVSTGGTAFDKIADAAGKTWVGYEVVISPDDTNLLGDEHPFTVTVYEVDGSGDPDRVIAPGVDVVVSWSGTPADSRLDSTTCTTDAAGECVFTVDSDTNVGSGTLEVESVEGDITGLDDGTEELTVTYADDEVEAAKTWREYRARLDADAVNPVDEAHEFTVTVEYDEGNGWQTAESGLVVDWSTTGDGSDDLAASTCDDGTNGDGQCAIWVTPDGVGSRTVTLTAVRGDLLPTDEPDDTNLSYPVSASQFLADDSDDHQDNVATKTWLDFGASIEQEGHNRVSTDEVDGSHIFWVTVFQTDSAVDPAVPDGTEVTTDIVWSEGAADDVVVDNHCKDHGTGVDDPEVGAVAPDTCFIKVDSTTPGTVTVTVTGLVFEDFAGDANDTIVFADDDQDAETKTWYRYRAWIDADSTNLAGAGVGDHDFTVSVQKDSGNGWVAAGDTPVRVTSPSGDDGSLDDSTCTTVASGDVGTCMIGVSSTAPGSRTVTVSEVQALDVDGDPWVDVSAGTYLDGAWETTHEPSDDTHTSATKHWVDHSATITPDDTNLIGEPHVFTVRAFADSGDGPVDAPAGTTLTVDVDSSFLSTDVADANTCDDAGTGNHDHPITGEPAADNECFVTVSSDVVDAVTVTVTNVTPTSGTVDGDPSDDVTDVAATKSWIAARVTVTPDETNIAGESHVFDVDVVVEVPSDDPDDADGIEEIHDIAGATVDVVLGTDTTTGSITASSCDESDGSSDGDGTVDGTCTVTVQSDDPGQLVLTATGVQFSHDGKDFDVDVSAPDNDGVSSSQEAADLSATKTWRVYRGHIADDGLNLVRDEHVFTVTVEQSDDGTTWVPVSTDTQTPTRATVEHHSGVGGLVTGAGEETLLDELSCETAADGTCTVMVDSATAGTGTFRVTSVTLLHPDGRTGTTTEPLGSGEYLDPETQSVSADKTWAAFRATIDDDSLNEVGDEHDFLVTAEYTLDGTSWNLVPDGSVVNVTTEGDAGSVINDGSHDTTCEAGVPGDGEGTSDGTCIVWVDSATGGSLTVTVASIDPTTDDDLTADFGTVTFAPGEDGVLESTTATFPSTDYASTKTWAAYSLELPPDAVNLLDGSEGDPERFHDVEVKLHSTDGRAAEVGGQDITVTLGGDGRIDAVSAGTVTNDTTATCTTGAVTPAAGPQTGTCTVTLFSGGPGQAELDASFTTTLGDTGQVTVTADRDPQADGDQGHVKTWTTFRVDVDPLDDQNIVGNWHVFTVTVEQSDLAGGWDAVVGAAHPGQLDFTVNGTDLTVSTDGSGEGVPTSAIPYCDSGTNADGQCVVAVNSDTVQAITLTATYTESYTAYNSGTGDAVFGSPEAGKEWIDYTISLTPPTADNLVNTTHTFTVTVGKATSASGGDFLGLPGVTPDVEVVSGPGTISGGTCVTDVTDASGQCTIELQSSETGLSTVGASYLGENASRTESKQLSGTATKLWWDYALDITPPEATNAVGDDHTFTATLTVDTGAGFGPAAGETLQFSVAGVGGVTGGDVDGDLACTTDEAGQCDIVINSDEGGDTDVGVTYDAEVGGTSATFPIGGPAEAVKHWVDIDLVKTAVVGDGFDDGDLVEDPGTGLPTLFFTTSDRGPKTAVFEYVITNTGGDDLFDLALVDDRLGGIDLEGQSDCPDVLAVGASCTARAVETFTYEDAAGGLDNIITNVGLVTASGDDGSEVSATDDAVIQLIAQQSSILIDLVKGVVSDAGDVDGAGGEPTVTWSQEEFEAGTSKTVRYRFTVTNVGPSPIVDVELSDPMISSQPIIAAADGVTLQPGESTVVEVDHELTAAEAFPEGPTAGDVPNVATVRGANETRDAFDEDVDDAIVFVQVVFSEVEQRKPAVLPATGLGNGGLLPLSILLIAFGTAILWRDRRRMTGS